MEYKVEIGGVEYGMNDIQEVTIEQPLFKELSVGNACAAELNIKFWQLATVPRMARIVPYARRNSGEAWRQLGVFFTDTRRKVGEALSVEAYDSMLKGEQVWEPDQSLVFPMTMRAAVNEFASLLGVGVDSRTVLNASYTIDYPANEYTIRDILGFIAGAHGGNWILTAANNLLLVPLFSSMPPETYYLVEERGDAITFGGVRILV